MILYKILLICPNTSNNQKMGNVSLTTVLCPVLTLKTKNIFNTFNTKRIYARTYYLLPLLCYCCHTAARVSWDIIDKASAFAFSATGDVKLYFFPNLFILCHIMSIKFFMAFWNLKFFCVGSCCKKLVKRFLELW